jgi:NAD(P)-dependent dehydrogenase (short-subunit alcohol dehydrogenase family)
VTTPTDGATTADHVDGDRPGRRVAIVIGASSGIGRATARALSANGWDVVLAARSQQSLDQAEHQCIAAGASTLVVVTDVADQQQVDALLAQALAHFGHVEAIINTAAAIAYGLFEDVPAEIFDRAITVNLLGTANVARTALHHYRQVGGGHLVLTGSLLGKISVPFMSSYVTGKWGVHGLARILQIEARQIPGVHVSLISPGSVNTPAYSQAANYTGWEGRPPPPVDPPEKVAAAILGVLHKPARDRSVGVANPLVVLGFRLLPAVFDVLVTPLMKIGGLSRRAIAATTGNVLQPQPAGDQQHGFWGPLGGRTDSPADDHQAAHRPSE